MKLIDYTGQRFGKAVVLERAETRSRTTWWKCRCDCGIEFEASLKRIRNRSLHSCGCTRVYRGIRVAEGHMACEMPSKNYPDGRTGTPAGYQAHLKNDEEACSDCARAHAENLANRWRDLTEEDRETIRLKNKSAVLSYVARHPDRQFDASMIYREKNREIIRSAKSRPCADCGEQYPYYVMQFDHVRGKKEFNIGAIGPTASRSRLLEEIEKCEVVCANCHAERSHQRLMAKEAG